MRARLQHTWSSNYYLVDTEEAVKNVAFIVNDWTGHIKALDGRRYVRCVSGDEYGINDFVDNGDSTVTDAATGLMWTQDDSGEAMNWEAALAYAEASTDAGYDDWRLPNVKELQSIADYSGVFPAIDSTLFNLTGITNEAGNADYPYYWTSTSNPYIDPNDEYGYWYAWYVAAGYAVDANGNDTHGAGAVRFDTKSEDGANGPDGERYYNYVRLVRDAETVDTPDLTETLYLPLINNAETESTAATLENALMSSSAAPTDAARSAEQPADTDAQPAAPAGPPTDADNQPPASGGQIAGSGGQPMIDLAAAAEQLGVTEETLQAALGDPSQGPPDLTAAAQELGVTEEVLIATLGLSTDGQPMGGQRPAADSKQPEQR